MLKKCLVSVLAAVMVIGVAVPAFVGAEAQPAAVAETVNIESAEAPAAEKNLFTASNGVLSIELPNANWKEVADPAKWIALSDGSNVITIEHFANGEALPNISVADDHYINVYEAAFSTQNEVFIVTGSVVNEAQIPDVCNAIMSLKVLKYDTKQAVKKEVPQVKEFTVVPADMTVYVTAGTLNVRNACSTEASLIGGLVYGDSVKVTGIVQRNGQNLGWYQIAYGAGNGYISANFVSEKAPEKKEESDESKKATGVMTIYSPEGNEVTVYESTDGGWYDKPGNRYIRLDDYTFNCETEGRIYTTGQPVQESDITKAGEPFNAFFSNGNAITLTLYSDGIYYSDEWIKFFNNENGTFSGEDGTTVYDHEPDPFTEHGLASKGSGRPVIISEGGGAFYDVNGVEYFRQEDGSFIDQDGTGYNVVW